MNTCSPYISGSLTCYISPIIFGCFLAVFCIHTKLTPSVASCNTNIHDILYAYICLLHTKLQDEKYLTSHPHPRNYTAQHSCLFFCVWRFSQSVFRLISYIVSFFNSLFLKRRSCFVQWIVTRYLPFWKERASFMVFLNCKCM